MAVSPQTAAWVRYLTTTSGPAALGAIAGTIGASSAGTLAGGTAALAAGSNFGIAAGVVLALPSLYAAFFSPARARARQRQRASLRYAGRLLQLGFREGLPFSVAHRAAAGFAARFPVSVVNPRTGGHDSLAGVLRDLGTGPRSEAVRARFADRLRAQIATRSAPGAGLLPAVLATGRA